MQVSRCNKPADVRITGKPRHLNAKIPSPHIVPATHNTGLSKMMDGIWNRYNLKSTGWIYTFGVLKCSEKFKVLDLP